jgi:ATP-GRASP peptide maturase of grasp-with-spasm system
MILILSNDFEIPTNRVIDWLVHYNVPFIRMNVEDAKIADLSINVSHHHPDFTLVYKDKVIKYSEISAYWFRRGTIPPIKSGNFLTNIFRTKTIASQMDSHLVNESKATIAYLHHILDQHPRKIGSRNTATPNKLQTLQLAEKHGLEIPETIISTDREAIREQKKKLKHIVTKAIDNLVVAEAYGKRYLYFTEEIADDVLERLPETIYPSLIQKKLEKKYELRVFYLYGKLYSMVIFSQLDPRTQVDFRDYNLQRPNRTVPYQLPHDIEHKLRALMLELKMETGSIDLVFTTDNRYVFLEVNPVGQFSQVSNPCNYFLFKEIADFLAFKN